MNLTLTNLNQPAVAAKDAAPVANDAAMAPAVDVAQAALPQGEAAPTQPTLAFARWLGLNELAPAPADAAVVTSDAPAPETDITDISTGEQQEAGLPALGAMAMALPLTPSLQIGQAALAAMVFAPPDAPAKKELAASAGSGSPLSAASAVASRVAPEAMTAPAPVMPLTQAQARPPVEAAQSAATKAAQASPPAEALAIATDAPQDQAIPTTERSPAASIGPAVSPQSATQRAPETVALSGPPSAWRQTLQEALGERMQLQVGKSAEQAVIRLEPPMLGRVEIAIRHSAGALEVHITATHGEVLRQLQAVSEGLRNDLVQRQFSEVSLNIGAMPKAANGAPMFAGGEGRGRQQDGQQEARRQEQGPGQALAEANLGSTPFSLNGRI